jgi:hypothetical protein
MNALKHVILAPIFLCLLVMDLAIFLLAIRCLSRFFSWKPLLALDRIVGPCTDVVVGALWHYLKRWTTVPLSDAQQEAIALFLLSLASWFARAVLATLI